MLSQLSVERSFFVRDPTYVQRVEPRDGDEIPRGRNKRNAADTYHIIYQDEVTHLRETIEINLHR